MSISKAIGQNIVSLRSRKGVTQEQLALSTEMSVSYLRTIEHGTANPSIKSLQRIAQALDEPFNSVVSVDDSEASGDSYG